MRTKVVRKSHHEGSFFILRGDFDKIDCILKRNGKDGRTNFSREQNSDSFDNFVDLVLTHDVIKFIRILIFKDLLEFSGLNSFYLSNGDVVIVIKEVFEPGTDGVHELIVQLRGKDKYLVIDFKMLGEEQAGGEKCLLVLFWYP